MINSLIQIVISFQHMEVSQECEEGWINHMQGLKELGIAPLEAKTSWENFNQDSDKRDKDYREGGTNYVEYLEEVIMAQRACSNNQCKRICQTGLNLTNLGYFFYL